MFEWPYGTWYQDDAAENYCFSEEKGWVFIRSLPSHSLRHQHRFMLPKNNYEGRAFADLWNILWIPRRCATCHVKQGRKFLAAQQHHSFWGKSGHLSRMLSGPKLRNNRVFILFSLKETSEESPVFVNQISHSGKKTPQKYLEIAENLFFNYFCYPQRRINSLIKKTVSAAELQCGRNWRPHIKTPLRYCMNFKLESALSQFMSPWRPFIPSRLESKYHFNRKKTET